MNTTIRSAAWAIVSATLTAEMAVATAASATPNCKEVQGDGESTVHEVLLGKACMVKLKNPALRVLSGPQPTATPAQQEWEAGLRPGAQGAASPVATLIDDGKKAARTPVGAAADDGAKAARPPASSTTGTGAKAMPATVATPAAAASELPGVADLDVMLLSSTDLFLRGRKAGATNVIVEYATGGYDLLDVAVSIDPRTLKTKLSELLPREKGIDVKSADNAVVLTGKVSDAATLDEVLRIAGVYGDGKHVVNLLRVTAPQQVMLEVKIAEVSKTLLDKFGIDFARMFTSADGLVSKAITGVFGGAAAGYGQTSPGNGYPGGGALTVGVDAQKKDGLVRVLAEPNILAISGQTASFNSGGKIFIPVAHRGDLGGGTVTLEEKPFGVSLKFSPTVLEGDRVNLKLVSEVSELVQTGSPFTSTSGVTAVLPSLTSRSIDTVVQLRDGQSFAVAGLIRNNITETLSRFPVLGELPVLGALFRSTEFQKDQTELIFIVTPRLVKPAPALPAPTDKHGEPSRAGVMLMGRAEGKPAPSNPSLGSQEPTE